MNVIIMGCNRVGAIVARTLAADGHDVLVIDRSAENLRRLPESGVVSLLLGDGALDEDLRRAGIDEVDAFMALEQRDARNALAAQKARCIFKVNKVVCLMSDPVRQEMYRELGLEAVSPATMASNMIIEALHG